MPSPADIHHISSDVCSEMMKIIAEMEIAKSKEMIQQADCFSVQLNKSVDKHNMDSIFATISLFDSDYSMAVEFLGECHSDMCGANGMLSDITSSMEGIGTKRLPQRYTSEIAYSGRTACGIKRDANFWGL